MGTRLPEKKDKERDGFEELRASYIVTILEHNSETLRNRPMGIRKVIQLRNGKATGPDDIPAESLKVDIEILVKMLCQLFIRKTKCRRNGRRDAPSSFQTGRSRSVFKVQDNNVALHPWQSLQQSSDE